MSLMTKRSFRHWQKSSKKCISKITKQHIAVVMLLVIIIIAASAPQIDQRPKKKIATWLSIFYSTSGVMVI